MKVHITLNPKPGTGVTTQKTTIDATDINAAKRLAESQYGDKFYVRVNNWTN